MKIHLCFEHKSGPFKTNKLGEQMASNIGELGEQIKLVILKISYSSIQIRPKYIKPWGRLISDENSHNKMSQINRS
jgi:hypothetical protein